MFENCEARGLASPSRALARRARASRSAICVTCALSVRWAWGRLALGGGLCARIRRIRLSGGGEFDGRGKGKAKSVSAILNSRSLCSSGGIGTPTTLLWEGARARPGGCADRSQLPVSMCHSQATHQLREAHAAQHSSQQRSMMHDALRQTVLAETLCEAYVAFSEQRGSPCEHPRRMYAE